MLSDTPQPFRVFDLQGAARWLDQAAALPFLELGVEPGAAGVEHGGQRALVALHWQPDAVRPGLALERHFRQQVAGEAGFQPVQADGFDEIAQPLQPQA